MGLLYKQRPHALQTNMLKVCQAYAADLTNKSVVCLLPLAPNVDGEERGNHPQRFSVGTPIKDDKVPPYDGSFKTQVKSALHSKRGANSAERSNTTSDRGPALLNLEHDFDVTGSLPDSLMFWTRSGIIEAVVETPPLLKHCLDALYCMFLDSKFSLATFRLTKDFYRRLMICSGFTLEKHLPPESRGLLSVFSENEALAVDRIDKSVLRFVDSEIIRLIGDAFPLALLYGILAFFPRWITALRGEASIALLFSCFTKDSLSR